MLNVLLPFVVFNVHFMLIISVAGLASRRISLKPCEVHGGGPSPHPLCFTVPGCNVGEFACAPFFFFFLSWSWATGESSSAFLLFLLDYWTDLSASVTSWLWSSLQLLIISFYTCNKYILIFKPMYLTGLHFKTYAAFYLICLNIPSLYFLGVKFP